MGPWSIANCEGAWSSEDTSIRGDDEICKKTGVDYTAVKEAVVKDPRIGDSHFDVADGGYRGYGGSCFPKDVNAIIELSEKKEAKPVLLKAMRDINRQLLKQSGLDEGYFLTDQHKKKRE